MNDVFALAIAFFALNVSFSKAEAQAFTPISIEKLAADLKAREGVPLTIGAINHYLEIHRIKGTNSFRIAKDQSLDLKISNDFEKHCYEDQLTQLQIAESHLGLTNRINAERIFKANGISDLQLEFRDVSKVEAKDRADYNSMGEISADFEGQIFLKVVLTADSKKPCNLASADKIETYLRTRIKTSLPSKSAQPKGGR